MPIETPIGRSQLADLLGLEPGQLVDIVRTDTGWCVVSEDSMQTTGTFPALSDNTRRKPTKKGK